MEELRNETNEMVEDVVKVVEMDPVGEIGNGNLGKVLIIGGAALATCAVAWLAKKHHSKKNGEEGSEEGKRRFTLLKKRTEDVDSNNSEEMTEDSVK